ncbi:MAG: hypothetical protein Q4D65_03000 [Peptostreptococcaceae bacterium]|nr:hypothetical protein [Peptostreptococcaceae bacterium]
MRFTKRKGSLLPLIVVISVFVMFVGGVAISLANSGQKVAFGNSVKMQSYYLSKAGIEMGLAFLYAPADPTKPNDNNWFEMGSADNSAFTVALIRNALSTRLQPSNEENFSVYLESTGKGNAHVVTKTNIVKKGNTAAGTYLGDIKVKIEFVQNGNKKEDCYYKIISTSKLNDNDSVNSEHILTMEVNISNEFDRKLY